MTLHSQRKEYYGNRILCYLSLEEYKKAMIDINIIEKLDPLDQWQKRFHLSGLVHFNLDKKEEAIKSFQRVIGINPNNGMARKAQERLDTLVPKPEENKMEESVVVVEKEKIEVIPEKPVEIPTEDKSDKNETSLTKEESVVVVEKEKVEEDKKHR
eukprot:UN31844